MKLCNDTITVVNAKLDRASGKDVYLSTVINGVSWYGQTISKVDDGLKAANQYTVRIPVEADFGGKTYVSPLEYANAEDVSKLFTLANGDIIVHGVATGENLKPAWLHKNFEALTILGVGDNRRAPRGKHWRVTGT